MKLTEAQDIAARTPKFKAVYDPIARKWAIFQSAITHSDGFAAALEEEGGPNDQGYEIGWTKISDDFETVWAATQWWATNAEFNEAARPLQDEMLFTA